jgi:hypothetical protein
MELLVDAINHDELQLTRVPIDTLDTRLIENNDEHAERLLERRRLGK